MAINVSAPVTNVPASKSNRREIVFYLFVVFVLLALGMGIASLYRFAMPLPNLMQIGSLSDYPPSAEPHAFNSGNQQLWIVHADNELLVFDSRTTHHTRRCRVLWLAATQRFEDPCLGTKFTLDGTYVEGPAPRNLDYYPYKIENGAIWVDLTEPVPGESACEQPHVNCSDEYIQQYGK